MKFVSSVYHEIDNLSKASRWHRANCKDPDCGVSLYILYQTARYLLRGAPTNEVAELTEIVESMSQP